MLSIKQIKVSNKIIFEESEIVHHLKVQLLPHPFQLQLKGECENLPSFTNNYIIFISILIERFYISHLAQFGIELIIIILLN